jgi:hypothetical protein
VRRSRIWRNQQLAQLVADEQQLERDCNHVLTAIKAVGIGMLPET